MSKFNDFFLKLFDRNGDGKVDWDDLPDWKIQERIFNALDTNGDGEINFDDFKLPTIDIAKAAKTISVAAAAAGVTAAGAYASGLAIIGAKAAMIGKGAATAAGVVAGYGVGAGAATAYKVVKVIQISKAATYIGAQVGAAALNSGYSLPAALTIAQYVKAGAVHELVTAIGPQVASTVAYLKSTFAASGGAASFVTELAAGKIAGLPIVKSAATSIAVANGEVIVIGGIAFSVQAAIALGLISVVVVGGFAYWLYNGEEEKAVEVKEGNPEVDIAVAM